MILAEFNREIGAFLPPWIWDYLQIFFGVSVTTGTIIQKAFSERFSTAAITCTVDAITTRLAQAALAIIGTIAFAVALDGFMPPPAPPRSLVVIFLAAYFAIQLRIIYQVLAQAIRRFIRSD